MHYDMLSFADVTCLKGCSQEANECWEGQAHKSSTVLWGWAGPAYRYHGCYDDKNGPFQGDSKRTLPQGHDNSRQGVGIDECAAAARTKGFPFFALQSYGICFFGSTADVARLQATRRLSDDKCSSLPCAPGAAICPGNINKIYFLLGARMPACILC
jgi:hypothetical protein